MFAIYEKNLYKVKIKVNFFYTIIKLKNLLYRYGKIYKTTEKIGNFIFNIYSYFPYRNLSFSKFSKNQKYGDIEINIHVIRLEAKVRSFINYCKNEYMQFNPINLQVFYGNLNKYLDKHYDLKSHINKYYRRGKRVFAIFPYDNDNFYLHYSYDNNNIYLIGNEDNLNRIILDFLTSFSEILPLHSSAVGINKTALCILSDSCCGKTSLMLKLLEKHFSFITDDSLFSINNNIYRVSNIINVRKNFAENKIIDKYIKRKVNQNTSQEKVPINLNYFKNIIGFELGNSYNDKKYLYIAKDYYNSKEKEDNNIIKIMKEPFPSIAHQSYWCFHYITDNYLIRIQDIVKNSINYWEKELKDIKYLSSNDLWENRRDITEKIIGF